MLPLPDRASFLAGIAALLSLLAVSPANASNAGESGDVCVSHYVSGANCTANDVEVDTIVVEEVLDDCAGPGDTATVRLSLGLVNHALNPRYDVGVFLATAGDSANSGSACYHDYLAPPLTTTPTYTDSPDPDDPYVEIVNGAWYDGDSDACGDLEHLSGSGSLARSVTTLPPLTIACSDTTSDGILDLDICTGWNPLNSNPETDVCNGVADATPITRSQCSCERYELPGVVVPPPTTLPNPTTTLSSATTTTTPATPPPGPIPAKIVTIKPGKLFKIVASGEFVGPSEDPTVDGATLSFTTSTGGQTYSLPSSCWSAGSDPSKGFTCKDAVCTTVKLKPGFVKAVCKYDTGTIVLPNSGDVSVQLTIGETLEYCAQCGGTVAGKPDTAYVRKKCPPPATCP